jgi:hypothetical protein
VPCHHPFPARELGILALAEDYVSAAGASSTPMTRSAADLPCSRPIGMAGRQFWLGPARAGLTVDAVEVDRWLSPAATFAFGGKILTASTLLASRQVRIRIETTVLMLFDLQTRPCGAKDYEGSHRRARIRFREHLGRNW